MGSRTLRGRVLLVRVSCGGLTLRRTLFTKVVQMDIVPFHFVVGSYEPGNYHGMGDCLVIRKRRICSRSHTLTSGAGLDCDSCRYSTTLSTRIYSPLRLLWRVALSFEGEIFLRRFVGVSYRSLIRSIFGAAFPVRRTSRPHHKHTTR